MGRLNYEEHSQQQKDTELEEVFCGLLLAMMVPFYLFGVSVLFCPFRCHLRPPVND